MKIAFCVHNFPPEFLGGTEQVVLGMARVLKAHGDEVIVIAGSDRYVEGGKVVEERFEDEDGDSFRVYRVHRPPEETYSVRVAFPVAGSLVGEILHEERPDFVHVHHWSTLGWDLMQRTVGQGLRGGITLHDPWVTCPRFFRRPPKGIRCPRDEDRQSCISCVGKDMQGQSLDFIASEMQGRDEALRRELDLAGFVTVPSRATADLITKHMPCDRDRLEVIPHGLLHKPRAQARPRGGDEPIRIGTFGNLVPDKGVDLLVEALAGLGDQVELQLSGHFPDPEYRESVLALGERLKVPLRVRGRYGPKDVHPALDLDLAVFPSLCQESYGLVVDEALSHGVPVVVSSNGALPERAARGGRIVKSGGVLPLHIALSTLIRSRAQLEVLRDEIPESFHGIELSTLRYRELYQAAISSKGASAS